MKGIVLAGGTGSRLHPLTAVTNKHLLPMGNYPMVLHPIARLKQAGITDILIVNRRDDTRGVMEPRSALPVPLEWQPCISLQDGLAALEVESEEDADGNR